ncbi:MAG TPA: hypothetical protein EYP17_06035 [Candidatus Latescibacteria bacterium]|nr:hypothetical protein [Candidatus Latescibacterota bacterium]
MKSYLSGRGVWEVVTETLGDEDLSGGMVEGVVLSHLLAAVSKFVRAMMETGELPKLAVAGPGCTA